MPLLLILEDRPLELRKAAGVARDAGFTEFEVTAFPTNAVLYLEKALAGSAPLPDAMVVDLDLGLESGFDLVRFWHGNGRLKKIPIVIWTVMGAHEREMCALFGVYRFVPKQEGLYVLRDALVSIIQRKPESG
jgi:CheY-like chemotaxis protein